MMMRGAQTNVFQYDLFGISWDVLMAMMIHRMIYDNESKDDIGNDENPFTGKSMLRCPEWLTPR